MRQAAKIFAASTLLLSTAAQAQVITLRVKMENTPLSRKELAAVLLRGHIKALGSLPSPSTLAMGMAQVSLENGNGKYSYNHNLGNIGPSSPDQSWYVSRLDGNFYQSFANFDDAAIRYWRVVKHCSGVLQRFSYGATTEAAKMLRNCGYFGADLKSYSNGMNNLYYTNLNLAKETIDKWWMQS